MDTRHLETLLWVVRLGGVGAAARHLNLTQPAVTRRIQELERELGAELFRRVGRQLVPTPVGHTCLVSAERILSDVATMRSTASGKTFAGRIRVGVAELVALTWFHALLARIEERYPDMRLDIDVDLSSRLVAKLSRRHLDILLLPGPVTLSDAIKVDLGASALRWMSHPQWLRPSAELQPADLVTTPIITLPEEGNAHGVMMNWFEAAGVKPRRFHYCNNFSVVAALVRRGVGISLMPSDLFSNDIRSGALVLAHEKPRIAKVDYSAVYLPTAELPILPEIAAYAREQSWFLRPAHAMRRDMAATVMTEFLPRG